ncbi:MAG: acyl-CoA dehydratase activase [Myxococcota bacterium]|nr:acyl-CoA dehydratase activase [Myxococcota bacterium]
MGSATTKTVVLGADLAVLARDVRRSGVDLAAAADASLDAALRACGASRGDLRSIVATGFGRANVPFAHARRTEIACHGRGAYHMLRRAMTVVDVGGQDSKIIRMAADGRQIGFRMNRKCAAGTGAFLEEIARRLDVPTAELDALARRASDPTVTLSSYCTVFAATEVLSRIRQGVGAPDLARAAFDSVAVRVVETDRIEGDAALTGGVAEHCPIFADLLARRLGVRPIVPDHAQSIGALGAALFGSDMSGVSG